MRKGEHAGWRSRGYLPHLDGAGLVQHIIFGLVDSIPKRAVHTFKSAAGKREWFDAAMDRGGGEALLRGEPAHIVESTLRHDDGAAYALLA